MRQPSSPALLVATLGLGIGLGLVVGQGGRTLVAQGDGPVATPVSTKARDLDPAKTAGGDDATYAALARQYEQFAPVNRTFEQVARAVAPSVVHIVAHKTGHREENNHRFTYEETGSGVIIKGPNPRDRYVLTNHHVVDGAAPSEITVSLHDGRALKPTRIWLDGPADIAVLKLGPLTVLPPAARLGDSDDAAIGSWVLALGSPFGLTHSVSTGIISARSRREQELHDDGVEYQDFLQTDAAINPGNSGGPLVNLKGEVIGINTAIASEHGGHEGVGFSIPINLARWIMEKLLSTGRVSRGAMGVGLDPVSPAWADEVGLGWPHGAKVSNVYDDSPAMRAGVRGGDVVLRFNGVEVHDLNHLINLVSMYPIGRPAQIVLWRERREVPVEVTIGEKESVLAQVPADSDPARPSGGVPRRSPRGPGAPAPHAGQAQPPR